MKAVLVAGLGAKKPDLDTTEEVRMEELDFDNQNVTKDSIKANLEGS